MARIEIASDGGSAYVYLREGQKVARTRSRPDGVNLDYDDQGNVIGVEFIYVTGVKAGPCNLPTGYKVVRDTRIDPSGYPD